MPESIEDPTPVFRPMTQTTPTQDKRSSDVALMAVEFMSNSTERYHYSQRITSRGE